MGALALALAAAVLAAEAKAPAAEKPAKVPEPAEKELVSSPPRPKVKASRRRKVYFVSTSCGVSFPFAGGYTKRVEKLRFEWPAFEWGLECGMEMPHGEVRLSFDSRTYDIEYVEGHWGSDRLLLCGGWRVGFRGRYELIIGGGAGVVWNSADHAFKVPIYEDPWNFAWRLYSCIRWRLGRPVQFELYGRLTFAYARYEAYDRRSTQDLSAGEVGVAVLGRF